MTGNSSTNRCRVCGREFPDADLLTLHLGVRHADELDGDELESYREVYREEESRLRSFRLRALGVLVLLYFGFLFLYAAFAS